MAGSAFPASLVSRLRELEEASRARQLPEEQRRESCRRLGLAARALGLEAEAEHYLELAGAGGLVEGSDDAAEGDGDAAGRAPRFSLQLLGQPRLRRIDAGGRASQLDWRLRRAFQSVAFLALAPDRRATKDELVDAVWHDAETTAIAKNFHPTLSEARRMLGRRDAFDYRQGVYSLNPELEWEIDCEQFRERVAGGRRVLKEGGEQRALEIWLEAWKLYRGPLLQGMDAAWIRPRRDALYRVYTEMLRGVGDLCARLERWRQALDAYRSLLLEEPFEERVHLAVMELYARQGRRDLVRRQFIRMQEQLVGELNVEPLEETQERYHQLMR